MSLEEFCKAIHVENTGSWNEILGDSDLELVSFWRSITVNVPPRLNRGKLTHIQHPTLRYFALFLARCFLARDNSSACTSPIVYLLKCAKEGRRCEYNLGVILARTLHFDVRNNEYGTPLFDGAIATLVYEHIRIEKNFPEEMGTEVKESNLLNTELLEHMDIMIWHRNHFLYRYMCIDGQRVSIMPLVLTFLIGTPRNGSSMKCNYRKSPRRKGHRSIHGAPSRRMWESHDGKVLLSLVEIQQGVHNPPTAKVQVVGATTIRDTSFASSLGESFFPFICCLISCWLGQPPSGILALFVLEIM
jgi:hypothetical protein